MFFKCEICHSFSDDGDLLNHICLNCIDGFGTDADCASCIIDDPDCSDSDSCK